MESQTQRVDVINPAQAVSLGGLFRERAERSSEAVAYRHYDRARGTWVSTTWREMAREAGRWQQAMRRAGLNKGDRVALMVRNSREWVLFDQAALGLGLVTVPLYIDDRPGNAAYILRDAGVRMLLVQGRAQWQSLLDADDELPELEAIISVETVTGEDRPPDRRLESLSDWLFALEGEFHVEPLDPDSLATIVFTSGTTGKPKGVMLSHRNILSNVCNSIASVTLDPQESFLSFLPLSHTFERTVGYYLPMMCGFTVAYNRSIPELPEDLLEVRPTAIVSVPKIYERMHSRIQARLRRASVFSRALFAVTLKTGMRRFRWRQKTAGWSPLLLLWPLLDRLVARPIRDRLGGRLHLAICGGAALPPQIDRFFTSLGLPLLQGYGLTESSPVITVNRLEANRQGSIGRPLQGVEVRLSESGELQTRSESVMLGYWNNEQATREQFTEDGWLRTGDLARIDEEGFIYITGRSKDIIVLSNGEKVPPADMEMAIVLDPLFEQAMVVGEGRPALTAVISLNREVWAEIAPEYRVDPGDEAALRRDDIHRRLLERVASTLRHFPGYAQIKNIYPTFDTWDVDSGLLTPTLKLKRNRLMERYAEQIEAMYSR